MTATFYVGDAIETMNKLPEKSVDLILTSPPFLALRSYLPADHPDKALEGGSQATPGAFIDWLVDVVEACDRVLAPHGSMCIELGDTYAGSGGAGGDYAENGLREGQPKWRGYSGNVRRDKDDTKEHNVGTIPTNAGRGWPLAKSLSLIPELFRLTLVYGTNPLTGRTTDRWRLRNVVRWVRPNPPVGALGDKFRPATSELMVFCKSAKRYFDLDAVREPFANTYDREAAEGLREPPVWNGNANKSEAAGTNRHQGLQQRKQTHTGAPPLDWWNIPLLEGEEETRYGPKDEATKVRERNEHNLARGGPTYGKKGPNLDRGDLGAGNFGSIYAGPPPLDWWNIPPGGYEGAHYAVFPPELCIKPIKAMCPEKVCKVCGEPSRRISEAGSTDLIGSVIRQARLAKGLSTNDVGAWFPSASGGVTGCVRNWESGANVPMAEQWDRLKEGLGISDEYDFLIPDRGSVTYAHVSDHPSGNTQDATGRVYQRLASRKDRIPADSFSDCGHDDYRPGLVLDPFVGSGTTLLVATGHGRDAIGIDLDSRNFDLALERVGPFILERG